MSGIVGIVGQSKLEGFINRLPGLIIAFIFGYGLVSIILDIIKWVGH